MRNQIENYQYFPGQGAQEKIHLFVRRHWVCFMPMGIICFMIVLIPALVYIIAHEFIPHMITGPWKDYIILGISAYILLMCLVFIISWLDYYYDILIITDERMVHISQNGLFNRHISELNLLRVQNVSTKIKGLLPTFFDYGNLTVETAGYTGLSDEQATHVSDFSMENVPHPNHLSKIILNLHDEMVTRRQQSKGIPVAEGEIQRVNDTNQQPPDEFPPSNPPQEQEQPPPPPEPPSPSSQSDFPQRNLPDSSLQNPPPSYHEPNQPTSLGQIADEGELKEGEIVDL